MLTEAKINNCVIKLQKGDITEFDGDAVVNAANTHMWMGAGVAGAIKKKGGEDIEREAVAKGPVNVGEAVVTTGGNLKAKYVIHAAVMGRDLVTSEKYIRDATQSSLMKADELGISRIAFPAFGTGVGGFPYEKSARAMLEEVKMYLMEEEDTSLREIVFYLYSDDAFQAFAKVMEEVFS